MKSINILLGYWLLQHPVFHWVYFLKQLLPLKCKIILTGGNHDSPNVINAPKELLEILDIKVVGGVPDTISELFLEIEGLFKRYRVVKY